MLLDRVLFFFSNIRLMFSTYILTLLVINLFIVLFSFLKKFILFLLSVRYFIFLIIIVSNYVNIDLVKSIKYYINI